MKSRKWWSLAVATLLWCGWWGGDELLASRSYTPPELPKNKKLPPMDMGKLVYSTDEYVGAGGKGCLSCHATKLPLKRESLARRKSELPKQVQWCMATRVKNEQIIPGTPEFDGLLEYLYTTYKLKEIVDEDPKVEQLMTRGAELFADGDYDEARNYLERALPNLRSRYHIAEAHLLLGIVYHTLDETDLAKEHFKQALAADPSIEIDSAMWSPKTVEIFYGLKRQANFAEEAK